MLKTLVSKYNHPEEQYLQLIRDIIEDENELEGRNGKTICNIGCGMYFNLENGKISLSSPIAKGLIGKAVGDSVEITTPSGKKYYEILEIKVIDTAIL